MGEGLYTPSAPSPGVLDLSAFLDVSDKSDSSIPADCGRREDAARALLTAAQVHGFALVSACGVGVSAGASSRALAAARRALKSPQNARALAPPSYRGAQKLGENVTQGRRDAHAALDYMRTLHADDPALKGQRECLVQMAIGENEYLDEDVREDVEGYIEEIVLGGKVVMRAICCALGMPESALAEAFSDPYWVVRLIHYPRCGPERDDAEQSDHDLGCGAHRDYGFLTFVVEDQPGATVSALQISRSGETTDFKNIDVPPGGCFLLNFGDCLEALTHGAFHATLHRVLRPRTDRVSIAVFVEPNFGWKIRALPLGKVMRPISHATPEDEAADACVSSLPTAAHRERLDRMNSFPCYGEYLYSKVSTNFDFYENDAS